MARVVSGLLVAVVACMGFARPALAVFLRAESCKVAELDQSFYFDGNTGNFNLKNVESVMVKLVKCDAKASSNGSKAFTVQFERRYPEFGSVQSFGEPYPEEVVLRWIDTFRAAKLRRKKVTVHGNSSFGTFIDGPILVRLE